MIADRVIVQWRELPCGMSTIEYTSVGTTVRCGCSLNVAGMIPDRPVDGEQLDHLERSLRAWHRECEAKTS